MLKLAATSMVAVLCLLTAGTAHAQIGTAFYDEAVPNTLILQLSNATTPTIQTFFNPYNAPQKSGARAMGYNRPPLHQWWSIHESYQAANNAYYVYLTTALVPFIFCHAA